MTNYNEYATDQYMRSVLVDEFSPDETDNALTALSSITSLFSELFPPERTFVRPDHENRHLRPTGVRFIVYGDSGIVRQIRIPKSALSSISHAIDVAGVMVAILEYQDNDS